MPLLCQKSLTAWKVSVSGVILMRIFPHSDWIRKYTPYLSTFSIKFVISQFLQLRNNVWIYFSPATNVKCCFSNVKNLKNLRCNCNCALDTSVFKTLPKNLRWSIFCKNSWRLLAVKYFQKTFHLRCLTAS